MAKLRGIFDRMTTPMCDLCHLPLGKDYTAIWCQHCVSYFRPAPHCLRCGLPYVITDVNIDINDKPLDSLNVEQCGQCLSSPPIWHRLYSIAPYRPPISHYIHQFKYQKQFWQAQNLSTLFIYSHSFSTDNTPDLITSVPLHWSRHWTRGFNQSELLARKIAKAMGVSFNPHVFSRVHATPHQQGLDKSQREQNLKAAFRLNLQPKVRHIAIVDDVVTTGSTVHQLCKLLLEAGVETVDIYCVCRTSEPKGLP